ncbi:hypothetical protein ACLOJK_039656 [Asimina triloba]
MKMRERQTYSLQDTASQRQGVKVFPPSLALFSPPPNRTEQNRRSDATDLPPALSLQHSRKARKGERRKGKRSKGYRSRREQKMSKKKSFSGSTMTLKDFHGGSIPSDLPLPSAPGVIVRPTDRSSFDRQIPTPAWGSSSVVRSDPRSRPGSSGPTRTFDEKTSFLSVPHIGRNFDEDERKPFDGGMTRRPVGEDSAAPSVSRLDPKPAAARQVSTVPSLPAVVKPAAGPNAWAARREAGESVQPPPQPQPAGTASAGSAQSVVSKLAHASAVEKVSSGRWQSKPLPIYHHSPDVEVIRYAEMEAEVDVGFSSSRMEGGGEFDAAKTKDRMHHPEARERMHQEAKERIYTEVKERMYPESKERSSGFYSDGSRPVSRDGKLAGGPLSQVAAEVLERPKLKLLPRTKPMESMETHAVDYKQANQPPVADLVHVESGQEYSESTNPPKPGSAGGEGSNRVVERPKLNLKPRSQPLEQMDGILERESWSLTSVVAQTVLAANNLVWNSLFGGARPRELVLKERGVDDVVINNLDVSQPSNRVKNEGPKSDVKPDLPHPGTRSSERPDNLPSDQRTGRHFERKDHHLDAEKVDAQRSSWRNDNRRNGKEIEKSQERRSEPESWRKPLEAPKEPTPGVSGPRFGRAVSAVELAQAFSRSVSDAKSADRFSSQRGLSGRNQGASMSISFHCQLEADDGYLTLLRSLSTAACRGIYAVKEWRKQIDLHVQGRITSTGCLMNVTVLDDIALRSRRRPIIFWRRCFYGPYGLESKANFVKSIRLALRSQSDNVDLCRDSLYRDSDNVDLCRDFRAEGRGCRVGNDVISITMPIPASGMGIVIQ